MAAELIEESSRVVLPKNPKPTHYYIGITTNFEELTFAGDCKIDLVFTEDTSTITFNSLDIEYESITVGEQVVDITTLQFDEKLEYCTLTLDEAVPAGSELVMRCVYTGEINDKMKGFYRSKYKKDGNEVYGGVTQFESTDARRAFPCWDEPNVKAEFTVEITTDDYFTVASNMPVTEERTNENATKTYVFEKSPVMSSYLVAWVIGEYECVETETQRGITVRCYAPVGKSAEGVFAAEFGAKCLDWYEDFFQFNYPLPKCDMFAIGDFAAGAMENWGLVTYRESRVLVNAKTGPVDRMFVAQVVAHELAHQWFGNLVTMDWWKELWLNEGFANFMESHCSDALTNYDYKQFFVTKSFSRALELDSLLTSHPIEVEVQTAEEVDEIFDAISYSKGGSTVRMIQNYLGDDAFRQGLRTYMQEHQYSNTQTVDLWRHLSDASGQNVGAMMANWTGQQGYPVVSASLTEDNRVKLVQNRFLSSGLAPAEEDTVVWNIPIVALTADGETRFLMTEREVISDIVIEGDNWVHLNHGLCGIYRVNYSAQLLQSLSTALSDGSIEDALDRYSIVSDLLALAKNGVGNLTQLLDILPAFKQETELCVWQVISTVSGNISKLIAGEELEPVFLQILGELVQEKHEALGFEQISGESNETEILRELLIALAAKAEIPSTLEQVKGRFWSVFNDNVELDGSIRGTIFNNAVKFGGEEEFEKMLDELDKCEDQGLMREYISACCRTKDPALVDRILEYNMTDKIRNNMKVYVWAYLSYNQHAREKCWNFVRDNWAELYGLYNGGFLVNWLAKVPAKFNTLEKAAEVEAFFDTIRDEAKAANRSMKQCVEEITLTGTWRQRDLPALEEYLRNYSA